MKKQLTMMVLASFSTLMADTIQQSSSNYQGKSTPNYEVEIQHPGSQIYVQPINNPVPASQQGRQVNQNPSPKPYQVEIKQPGAQPYVQPLSGQEVSPQ